MEFKILSRRNSPLLNRERINIEASFPGEATPKKDSMKSSIAGFLKADENLMSVRHIYTRFGDNTAKVVVNLYSDVEGIKRFETKKEKKKPGAKKE